MVKKKKIYYCENCKKWRGSSKQCPECKQETAERELPTIRGNYYFIEGVDRPLPRVTDILKILDKPGLNYWKQKVLIEIALSDPTLSVQEIIAESYKERDEAGAKGLDVHKIIGKISKGEEADEQAINKIPQIQAYRKFCQLVPHRVLSSELVVYSKELGYAGTLDALIQTFSTAIIEGKEKIEQAKKAGYEIVNEAKSFAVMRKYNGVWLIDYKTSNNVYCDDFLQLSAYKAAMKEMNPKIKIYGLVVVHLKKDGNFAFIEGKDCFDVFEAILKVYRWLNGKEK